MTILFSPSHKCCYLPGIHGEAIPEDAVEISLDQYKDILSARELGKVVAVNESGDLVIQDPPPPPAQALIEALSDAVQKHMDAQARALMYDNILSAVTYAEDSINPKFQAEGRAFRAWRSLAWSKCYQVLEDVTSGKRAVPTASELISELPALVITYLTEDENTIDSDSVDAPPDPGGDTRPD